MTTTMNTPTDKLKVVLTRDAMAGQLAIPADLGQVVLTDELCCQRLAAAGIAVTEAIGAQVKAKLDAWRQSPTAMTLTFRGRPAANGVDGHVQWEPACDPAQFDDVAGDASRVDHYNRRSYVTVTETQPIGRLIEATAGSDGIDLRGNTVKAEPGKPLALKPDDTIVTDASGCMAAGKTGLLKISGGVITISPVLNITGCVDFHTGNINFDGDVEIKEGIRDKFAVQSTGSATVHGLIEAATLQIGADLHALGGIAAKNKSDAKILGNLHARYLNGFVGTVKRSAHVEREIIDCQLNVEGDLIAPNGELIGGKTWVAGTAQVKSLGAPSGDRTVLVLASIAEVEEQIAHADAACREAQQQLAATETQLQQLKSFTQPPASVREKLTELMFEQSNYLQNIKVLTAKKLKFQQHQQQMCKVDLHVQQAIEPGTVIICRGTSAKFDTRVPGPLMIGWDSRLQQLVYKTGPSGEPQPIAYIAKVATIS